MQSGKHKWLDRKEYPFTSYYLNVNGTSLHYIDEGQDDPVLFLHGTPSWSFDFRKIIKHLSKNYRCIAPDHIGFGLSEKPAHYNYSLQNHTVNLELLIANLKLKNITLVVHDFGGPIGFQYAIKHPDTIKQIVVLNSLLWDFSSNQVFKTFKKVADSPLLSILYKYFNFSPKVMLPKSFGDHRIGKSVLRNYTKAFAKPSERVGCLAFAYSLLKDQNQFESLWNQRSVLQSKQVLFI